MARLCQLATEAGGTAPINTSRVMPPVTATTNESTSTPKRSNLFWTASSPPLRANTNEPTPSSIAISAGDSAWSIDHLADQGARQLTRSYTALAIALLTVARRGATVRREFTVFPPDLI